jgi:hypothetical protein
MINSVNQYSKVLSDFPKLTLPDFADHVPHHEVEHHIHTEESSVWSRPWRLDTSKLQAAQKEFNSLLPMGIIQLSDSQWASPLYMVKKSNGEWRPCEDYQILNAITTPDRYPIPHIQDFTAQLRGARLFSKIDLIRGYHQIPVSPVDRPKTAITMPFGLFHFCRVPF